MTVTRKPRLLPTGDCFCGCGGEAEIGRWFVRGHDITAAAALRAVEGQNLPQRLVQAGFGPERSVVEEAVQRAGWARCSGCAYAGPPAGLAAHLRAGGCAASEAAGPEELAAEQEPAVVGESVVPGARSRSGRGPAAETGTGDVVPVRAEAGPGRGRVLPGPDDPSWDGVPVELRRQLGMAAHRLVTPERGPLKDKANRRLLFALRAAARSRMSGAHWLLLLTSPREAFGSARSERAGVVFGLLERVAAEHVAPAAGEGATRRPEDADHAVEATSG